MSGRNTYIGDAERSQSCIHGGKRSVLADTLGAVRLDSAVDDLAGHRRDDKLRARQHNKISASRFVAYLGNPDLLESALSLSLVDLRKCKYSVNSVEGADQERGDTNLQRSAVHKQPRRLNLRARLGNVRDDGA